MILTSRMTQDSHQRDTETCQILACQKMPMFVARIDFMPIMHCSWISYVALQSSTSICIENLLTQSTTFHGKGKFHYSRSVIQCTI